MEPDVLLKRLQKMRFFEGYSEAAVAQAVKDIRKRLAAGTAGPYREDFERFPGLSLVVIDLEHELTGWDDLKHILKQLGAASYALFVPQNIRIKRKPGERHYQLSFKVNGTHRAMVLEDDSWIPNEFFEALDKITLEECRGLAFHAVEYPEPSQSGFYLWCTPRAFKALSRAKLIPSPNHPLQADSPEEPSAEMLTLPEPIIRLPPPQDPARAARMGLFNDGQWIVPMLSASAVESWSNVDLPQLSLLSHTELNTQINRAFDLVCAFHCGVRGLGAPMAYAKQVIALVDCFLFGASPTKRIPGDSELTEAGDREELFWSLGLPAGCVVAVAIGDDKTACKFLGYVGGDVRRGSIGDGLAFYRLLSDVFQRKSAWDWNEQSSIIEGGFDKRLKILLRCLQALKDNDQSSFEEMIGKLAELAPGSLRPLRYANVVDCEVTLIADMAGRLGWPCDYFPECVQDRILDRRIFSVDYSPGTSPDRA